MTLTDVYCRFNRARGMEVCICQSLWIFSLIKTIIRCIMYKHSSFRCGSLSPTSFLYVTPTFEVCSIFDLRNVEAPVGWPEYGILRPPPPGLLPVYSIILLDIPFYLIEILHILSTSSPLPQFSVFR